MILKNFRRLAFRLFQAWEALVFTTAFLAGLLALHDRGIIDFQAFWDPAYLSIFAVLAVLWVWLLHALALYSSRRLITRANETVSVLGAVVIAAGFMAVLGALIGLPMNQAPFLISFVAICSALMIIGRTLCRMFLRTARAHGRNLRFVAVVGAGHEGQNLARKILRNPANGYQLLGFFDHAMSMDRLPRDLKRGGSLEDLTQRMMREPVDEVLITLPFCSHYDEIFDIVERYRRVGVPVRVVGDFLTPSDMHPSIEFIGETASLRFSHEPNWGWQGQAKSVFDFTISGLTLLIFAPLLIAIAVAIKLDSPGPVLFSQTRVGKNKKPFRLFKFRSMRQDAEAMQAALETQNEAGGPVFKIRNDPRVTRLGQFLRRHSLDELPQLLNVLRGEMSIVGPRPLPLRDVKRFEHDWHSRRFSVRPGLTCSWVLAGRSEIDFDKWVAMDLDYIDNWSLMKDLKICLHTIPTVLKGAGAY